MHSTTMNDNNMGPPQGGNNNPYGPPPGNSQFGMNPNNNPFASVNNNNINNNNPLSNVIHECMTIEFLIITKCHTDMYIRITIDSSQNLNCHTHPYYITLPTDFSPQQKTYSHYNPTHALQI